MDFSGIIPPLITPFTHQKIDFSALQTLLEGWRNLPLRGFVLLGSTGEAAHLSVSEREELLRQVLPSLPEDQLKIAGVIEHALKPALEFIELAARYGAQAALVLTPHYFRTQMSEARLAAYYQQLATQSPLPILIYHFPAVTGLELSPSFFARLSDHPRIVGIKDSSGNLILQQTLIARCQNNFAVLTGSAATLFPSLVCGAAGAIVALANLLPRTCLRLFWLVRRGEWETARQLQQRLLKINFLVTGKFGIAGLKYAMAQLGLPAGDARVPLAELSPRGREEIDQELKHLTDLLEAERANG